MTNSKTHGWEQKMSEYLHLIQQIRMPQSYAYASRTGFSPGLMGSEYVSVVLPPLQLPGRSRLKLWYRLARDKWIKATMRGSRMATVCKRSTQFWLYCAFRWMHFLQQQAKMNEIRVVVDQDLKRALQKAILQVFAFRLEYVVFYCHLRRVWQQGRRDQMILPDPYGLCPRVCSERSGNTEEGDDEVGANNDLNRPANRMEQCVSPIDLPTTLTSSCLPHPHVGLHTIISFSCECPATTEYKWMCGPKMCSFHLNWRMPGYWQENDEEVEQESTLWRFDPPNYYKHLHCSREGTFDVAYTCLNDKGQPTYGFVKPKCRKAEYCVCKPQYHGALCDKIKNPCEQSIGNLPSGHIACRAVGGNKCIADMRSGTYSCQCLSSFRSFRFTKGLMVGRDNCAEQLDVCQKAKCQHGKCITASDWNPEVGHVQLMAKCLCEKGWRGRHCSHPHSTNNWTPWTAWSLCQPSCQRGVYGGNRYRHRTRKCLDPYRGDCQLSERGDYPKGSDPQVTEKRICRPRPCNRYLKLVSQSIEKAPMHAMHAILQTTKVIRVIIIVTCILLPLVMALAFWTVVLQSRRAGLRAKEIRLKAKGGQKERKTIEEKPRPNMHT